MINIDTKMCSKCQIEKPLNEFNKSKTGKYGICSNCKICTKQYGKQYRSKNPEKIKEKNKRFILKNPTYYSQYHKQYRKNNPEKEKQRRKKHHIKNKERENQNSRQYYLNNKETIDKYNRQYEIKNKKKLQQKRTKRHLLRLKKDINYKILCNLRTSQGAAIKNNQKSGHSVDLLMMSVKEFKIYIEKQFLPGMTWDNWGRGRGKWNIDHIIPIDFFHEYISDPVEQYMCFRWQNLQPLWWEDNNKKSNKIIY